MGWLNSKSKEEPRLENQYSAKAWLYYKGISFDESVVPPEIPRPYDAVQATRLASKIYLEPKTLGEKRQQESAAVYFSGLEKLRKTTTNFRVREYVWQFEQKVKAHGSRLADETKKSKSQINNFKKEKNELKGKMGTILDLIGFRGLTGFAVYEILNESLSDVDIDLYGINIKGSSIAVMGALSSLVFTTTASNWWDKRKQERVWERLKRKSRKIYEQSVLENAELYERNFQKGIKGLKPKKQINGY